MSYPSTIPCDKRMTENVFIVGSPRSGTTLVGEILDSHPSICRWFEPYFVVERYFRDAPNDCLSTKDATREVSDYILRAYENYRLGRRRQIVVDKSPRNSLRIPFLRTIFPSAKFIHMLRDGRDATLSINQQWQRRTHTFGESKNPIKIIAAVKRSVLDPQPLLGHKMAALRFEIGTITDVLRKRSLLHRQRWGGRLGWGPRFGNWQDVIDKISILEFNAIQWLKCVEAVLSESQQIDEHHFIEVRYETLLEQPEATLKRVLDFLELEMPTNFVSQLPAFRDNNYNKWKTAFSDPEKVLIGPILNPLLMRLGYASDDAWYRQMS